MNVNNLHSKKKLVKSENDLFHHPASVLLQPVSYSDGNKSFKTLYEALVCGFKMTIMAPKTWQHSQHNCLESMRDLDVSQAKESGNTLGAKVNTLFIPSAIFTTFPSHLSWNVSFLSSVWETKELKKTSLTNTQYRHLWKKHWVLRWKSCWRIKRAGVEQNIYIENEMNVLIALIVFIIPHNLGRYYFCKIIHN